MCMWWRRIVAMTHMEWHDQVLRSLCPFRMWKVLWMIWQRNVMTWLAVIWCHSIWVHCDRPQQVSCQVCRGGEWYEQWCNLLEFCTSRCHCHSACMWVSSNCCCVLLPNAEILKIMLWSLVEWMQVRHWPEMVNKLKSSGMTGGALRQLLQCGSPMVAKLVGWLLYQLFWKPV